MSKIRPVISESNKYWISKERYYELKHFCMQYEEWVHVLECLNNIKMTRNINDIPASNGVSDPTARIAVAKEYYEGLINMIHSSAEFADIEIKDYIIEGVTTDASCKYLISRGMPCCRDKYYSAYRKFFWRLSSLRR